jgi:hypothetical protein
MTVALATPNSAISGTTVTVCWNCDVCPADSTVAPLTTPTTVATSAEATACAARATSLRG